MPSRRAGDDDLVAAATDGIARLNARYPNAAGADRFLLLHRRRGLERGAGRLDGMGAQARQAARAQSPAARRGRHDVPRHRIAACQPTSAMSSPSTPTRDCRAMRSSGWSARWRTRSTGRVSIRSRTASSRATACCSRASRPRCRSARKVRCSSASSPATAASIPTRRPCRTSTRTCSAKGSYSGKGIYDVDAFEAALQGRVPDDTMLSHDLFEGVFARSGLVSDIEVVEEFPARYDVACGAPASLGARRLAAAALDARPGEGRRRRRGQAACRRSACGRCSTICGAPCRRRPRSSRCWRDGRLPLPAALVWTGFVLLTVALPTLLPVIAALVPRHAGITLRSHFAALGDGYSRCACADRPARGLSRSPGLADAGCDRPDPVSAVRQPPPSARLDHRGPVQEHASHRLDRLLSARWRGASSIASLAALFVWYAGGAALPVAAPFILAWLFAPAIARWVSLAPADAGSLAISEADARRCG